MFVPKKNVFRKMADIRGEKEIMPDSEEGRGTGYAANHAPALHAMAVLSDTEKTKPPRKMPRLLLGAVFVLILISISVTSYVVLAKPSSIYSLSFSKKEATSSVDSAWDAWTTVQSFAVNSITLAKELAEFSSLGMSEFIKGDGEAVLARMSKIETALNGLTVTNTRALSENEDVLRIFEMMPLEFAQASRDVRILREWLLGRDRTILVFFQNPGEMRPTGGFWGSAAEVKIKNGGLVSIHAFDAADLDQGASSPTMPPLPLRYLGSRWRVADANWSPDFSVSASSAFHLLSLSDMYRQSPPDVILAVTASAARDAFHNLGPLTLSSGTVIDEDTFLEAIRLDIQEARSKNEPNPKEVLGEIVPALMERLSEATPLEKQSLLASVPGWVKTKDIQAYAVDDELQSVFKELGAAGGLSTITDRHAGDYLSIAESTIGGEKSAYRLKRTLKYTAQLDEEGNLGVNLELLRKHEASAKDYAWYAAENRSYLEVRTPSGTRLEHAENIWERAPSTPPKIASPIFDETVKAFEFTAKQQADFQGVGQYTEQNRSIFSFWTRVARGNEKNIKLDYARRLLSRPADGVAYSFVFDWQAGVEEKRVVNISAPIGYEWRETDLPVYEETFEDAGGRTELVLTLKKLQ